VLESPAGQAHADFALPFSDLQVENFILRIGQPQRGRRRTESNALDAAREFGAALFQSVMRDEVGGAYRSSLLSAEQRGAGLRVRLRLSGAPDLVGVPWEFLFDSTAKRFVALSSESPIVRFLDVPGTTSPLKVTPPIKALVVISSPSDFEALDVEAEWSRLQEAVKAVQGRGLLSLERLEKPTLVELQRALRRDYHILHFVGHGGFDEKGQDGLLVFEDEQGRGNEVSATYLSTILHDAETLRLAVLNACDGARSSRNDQFAGVAQSLLQQGVPAVVAMQFPITDDAALTFAREFYGAFAEGLSVEASLAEARKSIFAQQNDSEWATPVLYLRSLAGTIFEIDGSATAPAPIEEPPPSAAPERTPLPVPVPFHREADAPGRESAAPIRDVPVVREPAPILTPPRPPEPDPAAEPEHGDATVPPRRPWWKRPRNWLIGGAGLAAAYLLLGVALYIGGYHRGGDGKGESPTGTAEAPLPANYAGVWWTNFAKVELTQDRDEVSGRYYSFREKDPGSPIKGTVVENVLEGTYMNTTNHFIFKMNDDGESFTGYWIDDKGGTHLWCGRRDSNVLDFACGYSGTWTVKGLPSGLTLDGNTVEISQRADTAVLGLSTTRFGNIQVRATFNQTTLAQAEGRASLGPNGGAYDLDWLESSEPNWDAFTGHWRAVAPAGGGSGTWCAWRNNANPPC
jgi:hypothetical protein